METNIIIGTVLKFEEAVFTGTYPKSKFSHTAEHTVKVIKESYGSKRGQHSFTLEVIESTEKRPGETFRKMGRNIYPTAAIISQPDDYEKQAEEKAESAKSAKFNKYAMWYQEAIFEGKHWKADKIPSSIKKELQEMYGH